MPAFLHINEVNKVLADNKRELPQVFVETGTYDFVPGSTIHHIHWRFRQCYTIEIEPNNHARAKAHANLAGAGNIEFLLGDSFLVLPEVLKLVREPALFWLDAHWCGDNVHPRGHGRIDPPLREEVKAIFDGNEFASIIMIDNVDTFGRSLPYENNWKLMTAQYITQDVDKIRIEKSYIENDRLIIIMKARSKGDHYETVFPKA
jgi:hypothetical protein